VREEGRRNDIAALLRRPSAGTLVYACGPARMLDAIAAASAHWPEGLLRVEHFSTAKGKLDPAREHGFEVELADSGLVLPVRADQTLLAALRAANIDVRSDCEEGLCGSCEVAVLAGRIDHRDLVLTPAERAEGARMMACCSRARDEKLVLGL
jgi:ferredoxin